jgi:hypothetical protein
MEILLTRLKYYPTHTPGQLYINGDFFCFTLEDVNREVEGQPVEKWKIKHETCIPQGRYKVTLEQSGRFGPDTPTINNVPGFSLIRIHSGNTDKDTDGCILLGYKLNSAGIIQFGTTRPAVADLKVRIRKAEEEVWITIKNIKN